MTYKARIKEDPKYKGLSDTFKLAINGGGFGKTNEPTNWQYDPFVQFSCTIGNQFEILMLIEALEEACIHVISANTDGIVCYFPEALESKYFEICHWWEKKVGNDKMGMLEYANYQKLIQTSVNDYIAIKEDGEVKKKGDFVTDIELHKNKSNRVKALALEAYFVNGIIPEEFIPAHGNIFDFCIAKKATWDYHYEGVSREGTNEYKKLIRYFASRDGERLYKIKNEDSLKTGPKRSVCESDSEYQTLFNKIVMKPMNEYGIDYSYYIDSVNKVIHSLLPNKKREDNEAKNGVLSLF